MEENNPSYFTLENGVVIPKIGFGTWQIYDEEDIDKCIKTAYDCGYRHIDTAQMYENESLIGKALKKHQIKREDIFITSKILPQNMSPKDTISSFEKTLNDLQTDYIDLLLIHWPSENRNRRNECWKTLEEIYSSKRARAIGVSNFTPKHLKALIEQCQIKPMVNQIEIHPLYQETSTIKWCQENGIVVEAYSPLGAGSKKLFNDSNLKEIAAKHGVSVGKVVLRWGLQKGLVILPRSSSEQHIRDNFEINGFALSEEEIMSINKMNMNMKFDWDPKSLP